MRRTHTLAFWIGTFAAVVNTAGAGEEENPGHLLRGFVPNRGQFDARVEFVAKGAGATAFFEQDGFTLVASEGVRGVAVRFVFEGTAPRSSPLGIDRQSWSCNYLVGNDPARHATEVPIFGRVHYPSLYPGVDLVVFERGGSFEYDLVCASGSVSACVVRVDGADRMMVDADGKLRIETELGILEQDPPRAFVLTAEGERRPVECRFVRFDDRRFGFATAASAGERVVIDPTLAYSSYLGGSASDQGRGIAVNASGQAFVTGSTSSSNFPTTVGAFDTTAGFGTDAFIVKLNASGTAPVYATYLGGSVTGDTASAIAIDGAGAAYVCGTSTPPSFPIVSDFPTTPGAFDTTSAGSSSLDGFVTKLNANGNALVYSTFLGSGLMDISAIALDAAGNAFVTGLTAGSFPVTAGAFDTTFNAAPFGTDAFVTRLNASGTALLYSTYLGAPGSSSLGQDLVVSASGVAHVAGSAGSPGFPTTAGVVDTTVAGAFVTALNAAGSALVYSTGLGGAASANAIDLDPLGQATVGGASAAGLLTTPTSVDTTFAGGAADGFVLKLNATATVLRYGTYLGGAGDDSVLSLDVDARGNATAFATTRSAGLTTTAGAPDAALSGAGDAFLAKYSPNGDVLMYASYLGGTGDEVPAFGFIAQSDVVVDASEDAYATGVTTSTDFPTTLGAFDVASNGSDDAFVTKARMRTCAASAASAVYGTGKAGTFGIPLLDSVNLPYLGAVQSIRISGGLPGAAVTMFIGVSPLAIPFDQGQLLVNPTIVLSLPPLDGAGSLTITTALPDDPTLCGVAVYHQAIFVDSGAIGFYHTAQTNGLVRTLGS